MRRETGNYFQPPTAAVMYAKTFCFDRSHMAKQADPVNHRLGKLLLYDTEANWESLHFTLDTEASEFFFYGGSSHNR